MKPDILILDIELPDISGIEVARVVTKQYPNVRVIALSGYADRVYVEQMLKAGAQGYVVKSAGAKELFAAIRAVFGGSCYLSTEAAAALVNAQNNRRSATPPPSVLGKREREVLCLLADGKRCGEIAIILGISPSTAEVHRRNIKQKLGLNSAVELTRYAIREGLIAV